LVELERGPAPDGRLPSRRGALPLRSPLPLPLRAALLPLR
jgi:hypothetical protein